MTSVPLPPKNYEFSCFDKLYVLSDPRWQEGVRQEVPNLFSLEVNTSAETGQTSYRSHLFKLQAAQVRVGRLNRELVRSLWASLSLELLYLTNDDDERYSIQAEERLLRNLTVQAADPPLGYPVYVSEPSA
jgi:hypothetical protein